MIVTRQELERQGWSIGPTGEMSFYGQTLFAVYEGNGVPSSSYMRYHFDSTSEIVVESKQSAPEVLR